MDLKRFTWFFTILAITFALFGHGEEVASKPKEEAKQPLVADIKIPYERPIGFSVNLGALTSLTFEGRFLLGLAPNISLVVSPSFQKTIQLPFFDLQKQEFVSAFDVMRLNLGAGIRAHFYEYDSWDGFFLEGMTRGGLTWAGKDPSMWSIIPSLILGYAVVYHSGYTVSFGLGLEYELLLGQSPGHHSEVLKTAYFVSKLPLTGELSIGWTW